MSGSFSDLSPRSFTSDMILKESTNAAVKIYTHPEGKFVAFEDTRGKVLEQFRLDDVYAVFRSGLALKLELCSRLVTRKFMFFRGNGFNPKDPYKRTCKTKIINFGNDLEIEEWYKFIKDEICPGYVKPISPGGCARKLLVVVNPIGGKGKGEAVYHELLKPMLDDAGTPHEVVVTIGPGHAERLARSFDLNLIGAVAIVGGDGLFGEFLNGMNGREDRKLAMALPIGVVPAGSSNCLACSVGIRQPLAAAFAIARGFQKPLDVLKVTMAGSLSEPRVVLSVCGVSYGFISEVNTFAGRWRWLFGPARYAVCGLKTILTSPMKYHVDCRFKGPLTDGNEEFDKSECGPDCSVCARHHVGPETRHNLDPVSPMSPDASYIGSSTTLSSSGSALGGDLTTTEWTESVSLMEPRRRALRPKAKKIDNSSMLLFSVTNLSIRQSQNYTVWNPHCHMASGYMDLVLMPVLSRVELLSFFAKYNKGGSFHKDNSNIFSIIKASSVEMKITQTQDLFPEWEKAIQIAIDGETYPLQPLRIDTLPGFLNFMCA
jgi:diacylglycerol kinase family enzyme